MNEQDLEKEIQAKGLNAPRLTPDLIDATIVAEQYYTFPGTTVTVACLTLKNGYQVIGSSACASLENFNQEIGNKVAKEQARAKIWDLEGICLSRNFQMCEVEVVLNPIIKISVNLAEAEYLQSLLQNPYMHPPKESYLMSEEPISEAEIRSKLYTALKKVIYPLKPTELR